MQNKYSPSMNTFFLAEFMHRYEQAGTLPSDATEITADVFSEYVCEPPEGLMRVVGSDRLPTWSEITYGSEPSVS